jgi:hypothetical protein
MVIFFAPSNQPPPLLWVIFFALSNQPPPPSLGYFLCPLVTRPPSLDYILCPLFTLLSLAQFVMVAFLLTGQFVTFISHFMAKPLQQLL